MSNFRVGIGYDIHHLVEGRKLILGGVEIPFEKGLLGHSDSDVLTHAICDALLGAAGLGDIGSHFPDSDPAWSNVSSLVFLGRVIELIAERGYKVVNIDSTIITELPKLSPFIGSMCDRLRDVMGLDLHQVNVKAKTNERLGPIGSGEAIAAQAIALITAR